MSEFHPHRFHPTLYAHDPYDLLLPLDESSKPKFTGPCKFHPHYFDKDLMVERHCVPSNGYYVCIDCKTMRRKEREVNYVRANGKRLRVRKEEVRTWDKKTKQFVVSQLIDNA